MNQKVIYGILVVVLVVAVAYFVMGRKSDDTNSQQTPNTTQSNNQTNPAPTPTPTPNPATTNWKLYTNTKYGFELKYPQDQVVIIDGMPSDKEFGIADSVYFRDKNWEQIEIGRLPQLVFSFRTGLKEPINATTFKKETGYNLTSKKETVGNTQFTIGEGQQGTMDAGHLIYVLPTKSGSLIFDYSDDLSKQIFSTFKYTK